MGGWVYEEEEKVGGWVVDLRSTSCTISSGVRSMRGWAKSRPCLLLYGWVCGWVGG